MRPPEDRRPEGPGQGDEPPEEEQRREREWREWARNEPARGRPEERGWEMPYNIISLVISLILLLVLIKILFEVIH